MRKNRFFLLIIAFVLVSFESFGRNGNSHISKGADTTKYNKFPGQLFLHRTANGYVASRLKNNSDLAFQGEPLKKVLILTDNFKDSAKSEAYSFELENLLGHFNTSVSIENINQYRSKSINNYDVIFFIGSNANSKTSASLIKYIWKTHKTVVWIGGGLSQIKDLNKKYGFGFDHIDRSNLFKLVKCGEKKFTRDTGSFSVVKLFDKKAKEIATIHSDSLKQDAPYIIKSGRFYYVADVPLLSVYSVFDRSLLFADLLHEMVGEKHTELHQAIVRIEDVTPVRDPDRLRKIADMLYQRNIPFLIGVVPFYVDPSANVRISLSDKPEMVEALKYCVSKGATIVLHGVTHQYKGVSAIDFEFWDASAGSPIPNEKEADIQNKIEEGIEECAKNGIYPLIWETPHYTASILTYKVVSEFFSSVIERRLVENNFKYGQYFPYVLNKDMYGEKIYPEDLGYLPGTDSKDESETYIHNIIANAKELLNVRDSYASFFFHPFLDLDYLEEIVDGISGLGYHFVDLRKQTNCVKSKDMVILSGTQSYSLALNNSYLTEIYYSKTGEIEKTVYDKTPERGIFSRKIILKPDEFYVAEELKQPIAENSKIITKSSLVKTSQK